MMLKKVFDIDNPVMQGLGMAFNLIMLNIIAIVSALPVVTAGASLVALFDMSQRLVRGDDVYIVKTFFASFRSNLKKGIVLGLIFILAAVIVVMNYVAASAVIPAMRFFSLAVGLLLLAIGIYSFGLTARFENGLKNTIANAFRLMTAYFPRTFAMLVITIVYVILSLRFPQIGMPVLMLFGLSLPVYIYSVICAPVFKSLIDGDDK